MATQGDIADRLLFQLAEDIETGEQMEALGRALGFKAAAINRYTDTNNKGDRVTYKGTRDMLFDWRQTKEPCDQHLRLKQALTEAKLVMLADTYLKGTPSITDISSEKISESLTVEQCREKLKNKYLHELCKIQMKPWDQNDYAEFKDMHTMVTMVKKDARGQDTNMKEILHGSVSDIFSTKVNGILPARILISAPAGRGKTTAVAKMAYDWVHREKGSALEHLPLLFVVKFRNTGQLTSIGEAIKSQLLSDVDDLTPEGLESFIRKNQGICHIILDGLDEYAGIPSTNESLMSNIVNVIRWKEFPQCRVLVTTRPHLENFFNQAELPRVYIKMWIEGFSRESSRDYIDKFFASTSNPNSGHGHGLKVYLDDQPLINELVKTPLFCLMVCHLWSNGLLDSGTTTQTELLDSVNIFLMHFANARSESRVKITPKMLRKSILQLGEVALTGLLDDAKQLVFTLHDFRRVPAILDMACELGIVSKTTVSSTCLPQTIETTSTTIEFYHKIAQEHSAGKFLAGQTYHFLLHFKISKLDRVLRKIKANIGDYENLVRFAAGTDNNLCIRIMEMLLTNRFLDESERYRILLDCSSETTSTEGDVSSLVQRCVNAESIVLKSPTVYTVVGMQNLPNQLKREVRTVKFEGSTLTADMTSGLWSCLGSFSMLHTLNISDSSLSFPSSPPELPFVTKLLAESVTSQSFKGLLSSLPGLTDINIIIGDAERDIPQITAGLRRTGGQQLTTLILEAPSSLPSEKKSVSTETMRGLGLLIKEQTKNLQLLLLSRVNCSKEADLVELVESCRHNMKTLNYIMFLGCGTTAGSRLELHVSELLILQKSLMVTVYHDDGQLVVNNCQLSSEITVRIWSCLRSFTSLNQLTISDSSLSFPPSPHMLPSVTKLSTERVTSQSYEGLLSSLPGVIDIDITIDDAERDIPQITAGLRRTGGQQLTTMRLETPSSLPSEKKSVSTETIRGLGHLIRIQTKKLQWLFLSRVNCRKEEDLVELVESCRHVKTLKYLMFLGCGTQTCGRLERYVISQKPLMVIVYHDNGHLVVNKCHLSSEITARMWSCLRSFTSMNHLTISDSSLSFPPSPPMLPSVTHLSTERVTSQSYEGLLSSLPGLTDINITIDDAERDIPQITAGLHRTGGQQLTSIRLEAPSSLPPEKKSVSTETMRGLGHLIRQQTKNMQWLWLSRVNCRKEEDLVKLVESCRHVKTLNHLMFLGCGTKTGGRLGRYVSGILTSHKSLMVIVFHDNGQLVVNNCHLSSEITVRIWSCLRSFTSLNQLTISDSSLGFPPSPPMLPSVTKLLSERVTSQSYEGLLLSLPGLREIDIIIDDAERDIPQITAGLRRSGGQQLTTIRLIAPSSLPSEKKNVSTETMRGLGLLIRQQTKNLQRIELHRVKCADAEKDLVYLIECCRHVKTMLRVGLDKCGTSRGGVILKSHLKCIETSPRGDLSVYVRHDYRSEGRLFYISHIGRVPVMSYTLPVKLKSTMPYT